MNKNPFAVATPYTPQQPPLPAGPPPQSAQADYSAYWAAAAAAQHAQQPAVNPYNPQWPASQPAPAAPRPPPEQSALYANYGYGGQQNLAWQQQRQPQQHYPPPPVAQPPPPPPQPGYNPYQPQAGAYQQPYIPQAPPQQPVPPQTPFQPSMVQQPQQYAQQAPPPFFPPQQQQQSRPQNQPQRTHNLHHSPPQHLPPAKRQRFDGPNRGPPPPQPQFQVPPPPAQQSQGGGIGGGVMFGQGQAHSHGHGGRGGGLGVNQVPLGVSRGGSFSGGRGSNMGNRGRGGSMGMSRGRGRGGAYNNAGNRGGLNQGGGSFRGHGSSRGFGNRDGRRGGSFNAGGSQGFSHGHQQPTQQQQHQQQPVSGSASFRGRNQTFNHPNRSRYDSGIPHGPRETSSSAGVSGKKEENRRTLTDFKILALEIQDLGWTWGSLPLPVVAVKPEVKNDTDSHDQPSASDVPLPESKPTTETDAGPSKLADRPSDPHIYPGPTSSSGESAAVKPEAVATVLPPPPSRIRIYFHTPVTADDAHPITPQSSFTAGSSSESGVRKGKRKKLDDDGDLEDGRGPPPPPPGVEHDAASVDYEGSETLAGRDSVAPSVASEGDWLMAAIGDDGVDEEDTLHVDEHLRGDDADAIGDDDDGDDAEGDAYMLHDGMGDDAVHSSAMVEDVSQNEGGDIPSVSDESHGASHHPQLNTLLLNSLNGVSDASQPLAEASAASGDSENIAEGSHADSIVFSSPPSVPEAGASEDTSSQAVSHHDPVVTETFAQRTQVDHDSDRSAHLQVTSQAETQTSVPLKREDSTATIPDTNGHGGASPYASTILNDEDHPPTGDLLPEGASQVEATQTDDGHFAPEHGHATEGEAAPSSITDPSQAINNSDLAKERIPSANRLSISYAAGTRRMVIDAEIVDKLRVHRGEARIEVFMNISKDGDHLKGIMVEEFSDASTSYKAVDFATHFQEDRTVPPFYQMATPYQTVLVAHLDKDRPLSEPRWVKTGDVQDWLRSMFGRMFWVAGDAAEGWEKKIEVVDPDPPPTIFTVLEAWATNSNVGVQIERQRFLRTHMTETDNILEILLRLVRGERATYSQSAPAISAPSVSGPLLSALSPGSAHGAQQTHVSLAVLAIFRLAVEFAKKAVGDGGKGDVEERVGEIIRSLPSHLIYKSLDGIFKEWRVEKRGGR